MAVHKGLFTWKKMIDLWRKQQVPPVEILPYDIKSEMSFAPWRTKKGHYVGDSNPQRSTAYHLAVHLREASENLLATYKIYAFCVENQVTYPHLDALAAGFEKEGTDARGWWSQNSRRVLPGVGTYYGLEQEKLRQWEAMVVAAAKEWTLIAEQWVLIRVPDLMLEGSPEEAEWVAHVKELRQDAERREYERLKRKFDA
ncbi:MAG: hypothetical protein QM766_07060 [Burkholderiaceae bacterium]